MIFMRLLHVDLFFVEFLLSIHDFHSFPHASTDYQKNSNDFQLILAAEQAAEPGC